MYAPWSPVSRVIPPSPRSSRYTGERPWSSATKTSASPSGVQRGLPGQRSQPPVTSVRSSRARSRTASTTSGGSVTVDRRSTSSATRRPSGEKTGAAYSSPSSSRRTRRSPEATSIATSVTRRPPASGCCQVVTTAPPSGLMSYCASSSARPGAGVRSVSATRPTTPSSVPGVVSPGTRPANRRTWSGPRSASQNRTGYSSWRIAETLRSLRALRRFSSSSPPAEPGSVLDASTTVPSSAATAAPSTPPGRTATTRASPPPAGSSHSAGGRSSSFERSSGRAEVNSNPPSGRNATGVSPLALRVSRRAGRTPAGSTSHSAET